MTDTPRDPETRWSPLEDDAVEDEAMDAVLASYTEAIQEANQRRPQETEDESR